MLYFQSLDDREENILKASPSSFDNYGRIKYLIGPFHQKILFDTHSLAGLYKDCLQIKHFAKILSWGFRVCQISVTCAGPNPSFCRLISTFCSYLVVLFKSHIIFHRTPLNTVAKNSLKKCTEKVGILPNCCRIS